MDKKTRRLLQDLRLLVVRQWNEAIDNGNAALAKRLARLLARTNRALRDQP